MNKLNLKDYCILAVFGALLVAGKEAMAIIPNVEIVSLLLIIITYKYGIYALIPTYIFAVSEVLLYGFGTWSISYLYVWDFLIIAELLLKKVQLPVVHATAAGVFGMLFGTLCGIQYLFVGGISMAVAWIASGLLFDIIHGVSNFLIVMLLYSPLKNAVDKILKIRN